MNTKGNIVIFFGPPGAGKGSISKLCTDRLGWLQLSTGNLCREHIANKTEIGKEIDLILKSGKLISDSVIIEMVDGWIKENLSKKTPIILDGFPRTLNQAIALNNLIKSYSSDVALHLIRMIIPDNSIINRLSTRAICQDKSCQAVYSLDAGSKLAPKKSNVCDACGSDLIRRADDNEVAVVERLKIYREHENQIADYFKNNNQHLVDLFVEKPIEKVYEQLMNDLKLV